MNSSCHSYILLVVFVTGNKNPKQIKEEERREGGSCSCRGPTDFWNLLTDSPCSSLSPLSLWLCKNWMKRLTLNKGTEKRVSWSGDATMHTEILERQVMTGNRVIGIIRPSSFLAEEKREICVWKGVWSEETAFKCDMEQKSENRTTVTERQTLKRANGMNLRE